MSDEAREIVGDYRYGFHNEDKSIIRFDNGLSEQVVRDISAIKNEPKWMTDIRVKAYHHFVEREMPKWGNPGILNDIDFEAITYFLRSTDSTQGDWKDVPEAIQNTFDKVGLRDAEKTWLGGITAQYDSEAVYHSIREDLESQGVIFLDMDSGLREHPELIKKYFGTVVPHSDNKFAALNTAVWSGGSFLYIPKGVHVEMPVQAYFRINAENMGQFERTLILADEGSSVHYIEGCTAPTYTSTALHSAVVELIAMEGAKIRYSTIQNWSNNVLNLVTKRAHAMKNSTVEWIDSNIGSGLTMKYPAILLRGEGAHAEVVSVAYAGKNQHQDTGAKVHHLAPNTTSNIVSKSISKDGGRSTYRGLLQVTPKAHNCRSKIVCDALILDKDSRSDTYPTMEIGNSSADLEHEASVSKVSGDQLFYLMSRGFNEQEAMGLIVNGSFEPFTRELPADYGAEMNKLLNIKMEGSIG